MSHDSNTLFVSVLNSAQDNFTGFGVKDDVAGEFRNGGCDESRVGSRKAELGCQFSTALASDNDIKIGLDGDNLPCIRCGPVSGRWGTAPKVRVPS
jgi:hypothetical protein